MAERVFLDTNILLYSIDPLPETAPKQMVATALLDRGDCALSVQVLQEFFHQAIRPPSPRRPYTFPSEFAWRMVTAWRRFPVQENTVDLLESAYALHQSEKFSWWDSLIVAAAIAQGCRTLYTEDMQDGRIVDRLRIVNPFRQGALS